MSKDGAVVVWKCSMSLTEMQEYVKRSRGEQTEKQKKDGKEREGTEEVGEGEEEGDNGRGGEAEMVSVSGGEEEEEDEDESEKGVAMDTVVMATKPDENHSSEERSDEGMVWTCMYYTHYIIMHTHMLRPF